MALGLPNWFVMKFKVLACDFDGTLASEGQIGPSALEAIEKARQAGLKVILVTGRTFFELTRVCERLDLFDAVVAENGAVLYFPRNAMIRDQGPAPPTRLLNELDQRGISYQVGRAIVGTSRADERGVREALEAAGVNRELAHHARLGDFSRWVLDVFSDPELARQLKKTEARWRRGEVPDLRRAIDRLITFCYGTGA